MTIKRRIFFSNIRIAFFTITALIAIPIIIHILSRELGIRFFAVGPLQWGKAFLLRISTGAWKRILSLLSVAFFLIIIGVINSIFTYFLTKNIIKSLEPLSEGVRQIHDNNLGFRINYQNDDEYRPICDAFNEMAAQLEASATQRRQDEVNRRELIAGISHDLRTPLTSIKGYLEGLETGVASTPEMKDHYFATIKNKTADMEHIIERLFLFSKLDMDEFPLALRRVSLMPVIADMIEEVMQEYDQRGLTVHIAESRHDVFVQVDMTWLRNVLINILENSVRYKTKDQGAVEIAVSVVDNDVVLRFTDDGPGVTAEALPQLFDVFYRADPSRSLKGSGLGLAISKKIIERMGGAIHAELPDPGGLEIVIQLPVAKDMQNG
jgi:signal transduction histidine kinase